MSPLASPPIRGYADWQRVTDYDTGVLFSNNGGVQAADTTPIMDVSRFAYLMGFDDVETHDATMVATWFADAAGAVQTGIRLWSRSASIGASNTQYHIANLGPFVQLQWNVVGGATFQHLCELFASNRPHPLEFIPVRPTLRNDNAHAIAANASVTLWPFDYYSGPVRVFYSLTSGNGSIIAQSLDSGGLLVTSDVIQITSPAAQHDLLVVPPGGWALTVTNAAAAAATFNLTVTPSTTGAT